MSHSAEHIACDGCGIAKDDLREIEMLRRRDEILKELFQNAARIRRAMRGNAWLRPIFRKYKRTCREILDNKNKEAIIFAQMVDEHEYDPSDLKLIQTELTDIHSQIKSLEEMRIHDNSSSSDLSSSSDEDDALENASESSECDNDDADNQSLSSDSSSLCSSSSSSSEDMDMEDFL